MSRFLVWMAVGVIVGSAVILAGAVLLMRALQ
jgi:hypothetical protein